MSVLDELREALVKLRKHPVPGWHDCALQACFALDEFEKTHPWLVDLTKCGPQCPAFTEGESYTEQGTGEKRKCADECDAQESGPRWTRELPHLRP
jgi:hypothetical protein